MTPHVLALASKRRLKLISGVNGTRLTWLRNGRTSGAGNAEGYRDQLNRGGRQYLSLTDCGERAGRAGQATARCNINIQRLVEARYAQGLTNAFDVYQLRQQEAQILSTLESATRKKELCSPTYTPSSEVPVTETQVNSEVPVTSTATRDCVLSSIILNRPDVLARPGASRRVMQEWLKHSQIAFPACGSARASISRRPQSRTYSKMCFTRSPVH